MAKRIITGLDIGSNTIKILSVFKKSGQEELEVLSFHQEQSEGIRRGVVINPEKTAKIISALVEKIKQESKEKINNVYVNINGSHINCHNSQGLVSVSRADEKISEQDINRVLQAAQTFSLPSNQEILDVFPKEYTIDNEKKIKDPVGLKGIRLEANTLILSAFSPYLKNLTQAVLKAGLQISDIIIEPLTGSFSILKPREKELGVGLINIGAGTTGLAIFEEQTLIHTTIFPFGSANITNDIAIGLKIDIDLAEKIKLEFGDCFPSKSGVSAIKKKSRIKTSFSKGEHLIKIENQEAFMFSKKMLSEIIRIRVMEIFNEIQKELKKISKAGLLPAGIVITGGGANLPGIKDFAKKELKLPCRVGIPHGFLPPQQNPCLASVCGLVLCEENTDDENFSLSNNGIGNMFKKIFKIFIP